MEKTLKFNSQIATSRVQSERLLALGLKPETADMHLVSGLGIEQCFSTPYAEATIRTQTDICFPAWSLHRLVCLYGADYTIKEIYNNGEECYGMLISAIGIAIEDGDFNEEYLEK